MAKRTTSDRSAPWMMTLVLVGAGACGDDDTGARRDGDASDGETVGTDTTTIADVADADTPSEVGEVGDGDTPDVTVPPVVGWCRLQWPLDVTLGAATPLTAYGRVYVAGLTDRTTGNDASADLRGRVGRGAPGTDPATWTTWVPASPNPDWDAVAAGEPGNDEHVATLGAPGAPGQFDFVFAFSLDAGLTWTMCDRDAGEGRDGSEDGYDPDDAGHLTVVPDPCATNPCTAVPPTCDGATLRIYPELGACADDGGAPACSYTPTATTACADAGLFCDPVTRACVADPCDPDPCTVAPAPTCDGSVRVTWRADGACSTATGTATCAHAEAGREDCEASDGFCVDGACRASRPATVGDLVISELMPDPTLVGDALGEWIEVTSVATVAVDLRGLAFSDAGDDDFAIGVELVVPAGGRVVLGRSADPGTNGGVAVDHAYGTAMTLANAGDVVRVARGDQVIDEVAWDATSAPASGRSLSLDPDHASALGNDVAAHWCEGGALYNAEDRGTPGAANPPCPLRGLWCRLQHPLDLALGVGASFDVYGRVYVAGVTDRTSGNDPHPLLVLEAGLGDGAADPASWTTWVPMAPNPGYDGTEGNNDEHMAALVAPAAPGDVDFAVRASGDGGATWTYCDRAAGAGADGSEDGYRAADAGQLSVSADPCDPNPCGPRPASCDGDVAVSWAASGTCLAPLGAAVCEYDEIARESCAQSGRFCQSGACVDWRPAGPGDLVVSEIMANPEAVDDEVGEWFELRSVAAVKVDLGGLAYVDNSTGAGAVVTIAGPLVVEPGAHVVFARSADAGVNGGVTAAGTFGFALSNSGDVLRVTRDGVEVAFVNYGASGTAPLGLTVPEGASLQLHPEVATQGVADDWCAGRTAFGVGDRGTPGGPNVRCRETIGWCRLQAPTSATLQPAEAFAAYGRVWIPGLTDVSPIGNDPSPTLAAAFAIAPRATAGEPSTWTWVAAAQNPGYGPGSPDFAAADDEWSATLVAPQAIGNHALAFRVSGDGGRTWTYCDTDAGPGSDGSEDGFAVADAGLLIVSPGGGFRAADTIGDLVLTEYLAGSSRGAGGVWLELYNASADSLDLDGVGIETDHGALELVGVALAPGDFLVVGASADPDGAGGVPVDVVDAGLVLDPESDVVTISAASGGALDVVAWDASWPRAVDVATSLAGPIVVGTAPEVDNDAPASWCLADPATPGAANPTCTDEDVSVVATSPADGASDVAVDQAVTIDFGVPMDPVSLSVQASAGPCSGAIRLSFDGFLTCVGLGAPALSEGGARVTVAPSGGLAYGVGYALRVTTAATSALGNALDAEHESAFTVRATACGDAPIVLSQIYGGGGNTSAPYTHDFVELHNRTSAPAQLRGWSLHYAANNGTTWSAVALAGTIPAGGYHLVRLGGATTPVGEPLPAPDQTATINMSATQGKVALLTGTASVPSGACPPSARVVDLVGFGGGTTCSEGAATSAPSNVTAVHRDVAGCVDAGVNGADFVVAPPLARNSAAPAGVCACATDAVANDLEPAIAGELDYCNLQWPETLSVVRGTASPDIYGRVYEAGLTNTTSGQAPGIVMQVGYGRAARSPLEQRDWIWFPTTFNVETDGGTNDEHVGTFVAPMVGALATYAYTYRASLDGGATWTYCDIGGAGANEPLTFDAGALGALEVTAP